MGFKSFTVSTFIFVFLLFSGVNKAIAQQKHVLASYSHVYDKNRDGQPSKCDCDYRKKEVTLHRDSSFVLTHTKGRMDPEIQFMEKGNWTIENDSVLVLHVKHKLGPLKEEEDVNYSTDFIIHRGHLSQWDEVWRGSGLIPPARNRRH